MARNIAIIGSGLIGVISALELQRRGYIVTLIDPGEPGKDHSASYGNAGWLSSHSVLPPAEPGIWKQVPGYLLDPMGPLAIRPTYLFRALPWLIRYVRASRNVDLLKSTARVLRSLLRDASKLHETLASEAGIPELIETTQGLMHIFPTRADFEAQKVAWDIRRQVGIEWRELEDESLWELQPGLEERYRFALYVGESGYCRNPGAYLAGLYKHALRQGATYVKARANQLHFDGKQLVGIGTDSGDIDCDGAVIAAGAYSKPLAALSGDNIPLESERGYHIFLRGVDDIGPSIPVMASDRKVIVTKMQQGLRVAGQVEIGGLKAPANWQRAEILKRHLYDMFPALKSRQSVTVQQWMGHRPSTPDGVPVIGRSKASDNVIYAFGHGHVGLVSSARTGRLVSQLIDGDETEIPIQAFRPNRF